MDWLNEMAQQLRIKSMSDLARKAMASDAWPKGEARTTTVFANNLRDLNRGRNLGFWEATGRALVPALAEALEAEPEELLRRIRGEHALQIGDIDSAWTFDVFPELPPLDLREDQLPPGLPTRLTGGGGPAEAHTWWQAPRGSGRTLLGRWLEVRFGWTFVRSSSWEAALPRLPETGRVYVELSDLFPARCHPPIPERPHLKICVASPGEMPLERPVSKGNQVVSARELLRRRNAPSSPTWTVASSPPPRAWLGALAHWCDDRVPPGGGFDPGLLAEPALWRWLESRLRTPGEALGFFGVLEKQGKALVDALQEDADDASVDRSLKVLIRGTTDRTDRSPSAGLRKHLQEQGAPLLRQMVTQRIRRGLRSALSGEEWASLVPPLAPELDLTELRRMIKSRSDEELAEAERMLHPTPEELVDSLELMGLLAPEDGGPLAVTPGWLASLLEGSAIGKVLSEETGLGTLLLHPEFADEVTETVVEGALESDFDQIRELLNGADPDSPERMAGVDAALRGLGLALVDDIEVPAALLRDVWSLSTESWIQLREQELPKPLVCVRAKHGHVDAEWILAALAISHRLVELGDVVEPGPFCPWTAESHDGDRSGSLDRLVLIWLDRGQEGDADPQWVRRISRVGGLLFKRFGLLDKGGHVPACQRGELLVRMSRGEEFEVGKTDSEHLLELRAGLTGVEEAANRLGVPMDEVLAWLWGRWGAEGETCWVPVQLLRGDRSGRWNLDDRVRGAVARRLWEALPADGPNDATLREVAQDPVFWPYLSENAWVRWVGCFSDGGRVPHARGETWNAVPEPVLLDALRRDRIKWSGAEAYRAAWRRLPSETNELIVARVAAIEPNLAEPPHALYSILNHAPEASRLSLLDQADFWSQAEWFNSEHGLWLRRWLTDLIGNRSTGWRQAYAILLRTARREK